MNSIILGIIALLVFLILMFIGVPVPISMLIGGFLGMMLIVGPTKAASLAASDILSTFNSYSFTTIPMFGMMGYIAFYSGIGENLFDAVNAFIGHRRGGLAMATQVASAIFGAICGSLTACIGTMCAIAYPSMRKQGYNVSISSSSIAAGAILAILIPPSSNYILYGVITENSVGRLFLSGIIPGIVLCIIFMICIAVTCKRHPDWAAVSRKYTGEERWKAIRKGNLLEVAIVFIITIGGLFAGFFTPSEAGAVGCVAMMIVVLVTKRMTWKKFVRVVKSSVLMIGMIYLMMACAMIVGHMFTITGISAGLSNFVAGLNVPRVVILIAILLVYFVLGMFTDMLGTTLVTIPVFYPILIGQLGYDPIWFGTIMIMVGVVGGLTPPVGTQVFVCKGCISWDKESSLGAIYRGVWPFVIGCIVFVALIIVCPQITTWLPSLVYG